MRVVKFMKTNISFILINVNKKKQRFLKSKSNIIKSEINKKLI